MFPCNDVSAWTSTVVATLRSLATMCDVHALTSLHGNVGWSADNFFVFVVKVTSLFNKRKDVQCSMVVLIYCVNVVLKWPILDPLMNNEPGWAINNICKISDVKPTHSYWESLRKAQLKQTTRSIFQRCCF